MDVQLVDIQLRLIAHGISIELASQFHRTLALMGSHISGIIGTIGLHTSCSCHPTGQTIVALHVARQHGGDEIHVLRLGLELHVSTYLLRTVQVGDKACSISLESGRQRHIEVGELHILHVTLQLAIEHQGLVGPPVTKTLWHRAEEGHEVLLTHHSPQAQLHLTRINGIGQRQGHIQLDIDVGLRGLQVELRQTDSPILHRQRACQVGDLQPTLLAQCNRPHVQAERGIMVIDGVDADINVRQVDMVIVEALDTGLVVLIILQGPIHPINTGYGIGLLLQVDHCLLSSQRTHMSSDTHRIAWHVKRDV